MRQVGADVGGGDIAHRGQCQGLAAMAFKKGEVGGDAIAIGPHCARRGAPLVGQMLKPGGQSPMRAGQSTGHRSAVRSTTRARKATSSEPISSVKPSGSAEPKAST